MTALVGSCRPFGPARAAASSRNTASSATSPALCTQVSNWCRVVVIPSTSGASSLAKAVASVFAPCVPPVFSVLLVIGGSLVPGGGTVVLADAILTPTLEPSLLSSQIQQRPGHPPRKPLPKLAHMPSVWTNRYLTRLS